MSPALTYIVVVVSVFPLFVLPDVPIYVKNPDNDIVGVASTSSSPPTNVVSFASPLSLVE